MIQNSYDLYKALKKLGYLKEQRDPYWWPNSGTFEVVVGAILTQQTKWQKVEKSLENLKKAGVDTNSIKDFVEIDLKTLQTLIKPSGFYNTKAKYIKNLSKNILKDFGDFEDFRQNVTREWLLEQKGIGKESADSILCYACYKPTFVVDSYTNRLLSALGYEFFEYDELKEWMEEGIKDHFDKKEWHKIFARFHGKIVEFAKDYIRGKSVRVEVLEF